MGGGGRPDSHRLARACNTTHIIANQHTQPDMGRVSLGQVRRLGCLGLAGGGWFGQADSEGSCWFPVMVGMCSRLGPGTGWQNPVRMRFNSLRCRLLQVTSVGRRRAPR